MTIHENTHNEQAEENIIDEQKEVVHENTAIEDINIDRDNSQEETEENENPSVPLSFTYVIAITADAGKEKEQLLKAQAQQKSEQIPPLKTQPKKKFSLASFKQSIAQKSTTSNKVKKAKKPKVEIPPNSAASHSFAAKSMAYSALFAATLLFSLTFFFYSFTDVSVKEQFITTLDSVLQGGSLLAPLLSSGQYSETFPFIFWFVAAIEKVPFINTLNIFALADALSVFLFVSALFFMAISMRQSARVALGASCIGLIFYAGYGFIASNQLIFENTLFASFMIFSLACFFRAWIKNSSSIRLMLAFVFLALAFLTHGIFALVLPCAISIVFLIFHGHFRRINDKDGIIGLLLFFILVGAWVGMLYFSNQSAYLLQLFDLTALQNAITQEWQIHTKFHYLLILFILMLPFFPVPLLVSWIKNAKTSVKALRYSRYSALKELELDRLVRIENKEKNTKLDKEKYTQYIRSTAVLFLYVANIVTFGLLLILPVEAITYLPTLFALLAVLLSRSIMSFSVRASIVYGFYLAIILLIVGCVLLPIFALPYIEKLIPLSFIPEDLHTFLYNTPVLSFMSAVILMSSLYFFLIKKYYPQKILYTFTISLLFIVALTQFILHPNISIFSEESPTPDSHSESIVETTAEPTPTPPETLPENSSETPATIPNTSEIQNSPETPASEPEAVDNPEETSNNNETHNPIRQTFFFML